MQYNINNPAVKRILREVREMEAEPSEQYHANPLEDNIFEWHFTIQGPKDTEFEGGLYHGRIILPPEYPFKPPNIVLLNESGRFEVGTKICLSISSYHPEHWQPSWSIRTVLVALISFMPTKGDGAIGAIDMPAKDRKELAIKTPNYLCEKCGKRMYDILTPQEIGSKSQETETETKTETETAEISTVSTTPDTNTTTTTTTTTTATNSTPELSPPSISTSTLQPTSAPSASTSSAFPSSTSTSTSTTPTSTLAPASASTSTSTSTAIAPAPTSSYTSTSNTPSVVKPPITATVTTSSENNQPPIYAPSPSPAPLPATSSTSTPPIALPQSGPQPAIAPQALFVQNNNNDNINQNRQAASPSNDVTTLDYAILALIVAILALLAKKFYGL